MKKVMLSALLLSLPLLGYAQERFPSPEAAASAFAAAVAGKNETQLTALLGDDWRQFLPPEGADPEAWPASIVTGAKAIALYRKTIRRT